MKKNDEDFWILINDKKINYQTIFAIIFILMLVCFIIGYSIADKPRTCHIDQDEVDDLYHILGTGSLRFFNRNTTVDNIYSIYNKWLPWSNYILEEELNRICD